MQIGEPETASPPPGQQAADDHASVILAEAAIAGLEELGAGLVLDDVALDDALARRPWDTVAADPAPDLTGASRPQPK